MRDVPSIAGLVVGLAALALIFRALEGRWPVRPGWRTDVAYWFFTPLVTKTASRLLIFFIVIAIAWKAGIPLEEKAIHARLFETGRLQQLPPWLQVLAALLAADLTGYWMHRLFHGRLWRFHAIHHASPRVDWLSSVRLHPVNESLNDLALTALFLLLGFHPKAIAAYLPLLGFYGLVLHAELAWDYGPLRYVIASPRFHRWHHTAELEGRDRNFAGFFPFIDLLFGTFYMPEGRVPARFGVEGDAVPEGLWAQLKYPFGARQG